MGVQYSLLIAKNTGSIGDAGSFGSGARRGSAPPEVAAGRGGEAGGRGSGSGASSGPRYFNWVVDPHPEDISKLDFKRPNGEAVMRTIADYRQLNDALFHPGLNSGSQFEYQDTPNRLHFYVIDLQRDAQGIRTYTLGVRSLDGAGPHKHGVGLEAPKTQPVRGAGSIITFTLKNTGAAAPTDAALHFQDSAASLSWDIYRLTVMVDGQDWTAQLGNALAAVKIRGVPADSGIHKPRFAGRSNRDRDSQGSVGERSGQISGHNTNHQGNAVDSGRSIRPVLYRRLQELIEVTSKNSNLLIRH